MKSLLIVDTETSGLDPATDHLLEVGLVLWSVQHRSTVATASWLVRAPENKAEHVNGIRPALLAEGREPAWVKARVQAWAEHADAVAAHNAEFDRSWLPDLAKPWICTCHDVDWPGRALASGLERERERPGQSLVALCLAHGVGVASAHRALTDCLLIAALLERVAELGHDVEAMLVRAMRPKVKVIAHSPGFDAARNALFKSAGFRFEPKTKEWWKMVPADEVAALPFKTRVAS